ncbi:zinc-dependent metalloprotease family protein [Parahaliea mediterranea]|uniref:Uncharacterized protein n=1 Tax=Parahaliea mediterranea TaxID=651086 RepID=A0A939DEH1_9GAMM|nr:zinc-dependent metalloprotease family protein [Parahaliea mediterranea]MBN7796639.1 hypothetical protein [Parahaliea mediterranea]
MLTKAIRVVFLAGGLILSGCRVEMVADTQRGCVALDGVEDCRDAVALEFGRDDRHVVSSSPREGYRFTHWGRGDNYLFGGSTELSLVMDAAVMGEDLPDRTFFLEPRFAPICRTDYMGDIEVDYPYLDCNGEERTRPYSFTDVSDVEETYTIDILWYIDSNISHIRNGSFKSGEFAQSRIKLLNRVFRQSGVKIKFRTAGIVPVELSIAESPSSLDLLERMRDGRAPFESLLEHKQLHEADLVHALTNWRDGDEFCGHAYLSVIDTDENYQVGVTRCHEDIRTLAHELGHNLGLSHEIGTGNVSLMRYGKAFKGELARTIMSTDPHYDYSVSYFSSPRLTVFSPLNGQRTTIGTSDIDAVTALNKVRMDYARIRPKPAGNGVSVGAMTAEGFTPHRIPKAVH